MVAIKLILKWMFFCPTAYGTYHVKGENFISTKTQVKRAQDALQAEYFTFKWK